LFAHAKFLKSEILGGHYTMRPAQLCVSIALSLAVPTLALGSSLSFSNHTQNNAPGYGGGAPLYQHADLNHDYREDLVFAYHPEMGGQNTFAVQLTTADGVYGPATAYQINPNTGIEQLVLGDFNNDGAIDILVSAYDGNFYLYQNDQEGKFTLTGTFAFTTNNNGTYTAVTTVGDFNHDGLTDIAFVFAGRLYVWFGNGNGGFTPGPSMGVNGSSPMLGDFDGDGKADLLLTDLANPTQAWVLYGDGTGHFPKTTTITFSTPASAPANTTYVNFSVGDVNSDGKSDILATQPQIYTNRVFVYYGDTGRQFASRTSVFIGRCVDGPASVADLDGNGLNDIIVREHSCSNPSTGPLYVDVLTRNANASYNPDQTIYWAQPIGGVVYAIPDPPQVLRGNSDTKPDLLVTQCADDRCDSSTVTTQLNTTTGNFPTCLAPSSSRGINICLPTYGVAASSPVKFAIGASGTVPMRDVEIWVDGKKVAEQIDGFSNYTFLDGSATLTPGSHHLDVYAAGWDQWLVEHSETITVQ
jgi:hypothetical protein